MHLIIDVSSNRLCIDGHWVNGQRRWDTVALATLIRHCGESSTGVVDRAAMANELQLMGQNTALDRTGWRRVWSGVARLFDAAGRSEAFSTRFSHQPRALTVGPWWWQADAEDRVEIRSIETTKLRSGIPDELHAIATDHSLASTLVVVRKLAVVQSLWLYGSRRATIDELTAGPEWDLAAPPMLTFRALTLADAYAMTEQYEASRRQLRTAYRLMDSHPNCVDQRTFADFIRIAISEAGRRGLAVGGTTADGILQLLADRSRTASELDTRSRSWAYMHAAYGLHERLHGSPLADCDREEIEQLVVNRIAASICLSIIGWHTDLVPIGLESLLRGFTPLVGYASFDALNRCIDMHLAAEHWRSLIEIPGAFHMGRILIAQLVSEHPETSAIIDDRVSAGLWTGPRPDTLDYILETLTRAMDTEDPKSVVRASLACYRFSKRIGSRSGRSRAEAVFLRTCRQHRTIVLYLQALGQLDSVPELASKI